MSKQSELKTIKVALVQDAADNLSTIGRWTGQFQSVIVETAINLLYQRLLHDVTERYLPSATTVLAIGAYSTNWKDAWFDAWLESMPVSDNELNQE